MTPMQVAPATTDRARDRRGAPYVRPAAVQWGDRSAAWSVLLLLLAVYTATFSGLPDVPDAEVEYQTTSALVRTGRLALGGTPEARGLIEEGFGVAPGGAQRPGRHYSRYGVGQALAAVPFYVAGRVLALVRPGIERRHAESEAYGRPRSEYFAHLAVGWRNPLLAALTGMLVVLTARRLGVRRRFAWWCGLAYGLCTFAWPQARSTLSDVQATFLLFLAFHLLVKARECFARLGPPPTAVLAGAGLALGGAALTRVAVVPGVIVLTLVAWRMLAFGHKLLERAWGPEEVSPKHRFPTQALDFALPLLACLAVLLGVNYVRFGSILRTGYEASIDLPSFFANAPQLGLAGILISPGRGLLWMAPGLLLLPLAVRHALRSGERLWTWTLAGLALVVLVPISFMRGWHGAWTFGPRYVLPLLPFAWLGFGLALEAGWKRPWLRWAAGALCVTGLLVQLGGALVDHTTHTDLALQAARMEWPDEGGVDPAEQELRRFERIQWDWRFAAPWAHWRILRHRVAGLGERFPARTIYFVDGSGPLVPTHERDTGFRHLAWVDLHERLDGSVWPPILVCLALAAVGLVLGLRAVDPAAA
jgi:hypothetical protein